MLEEKNTDNGNIYFPKVKIESVLNLMLDGYWLLNKNEIIVDVNQSYCEMSGYSKEEIIGKKVRDLQV